MKQVEWRSLIPAITTAFREDGAVDHDLMARHAHWLHTQGAQALCVLTPLGEGEMLTPGEKLAILEHLAISVADRFPLICTVRESATRDAIGLARAARERGCAALMISPPPLHRGPWAEVRAHLEAIVASVPLPTLLCAARPEDPLALRPDEVAELLATCPEIEAVMDASADARHLPALRQRLGPDVPILCGLDEAVVRSSQERPCGWVSGLANALPAECTEVLRRLGAHSGGASEAAEWLHPLAGLHGAVDAVQAIKLLQSEMGWGTDRVRRPRLALHEDRRGDLITVLRQALSARPQPEQA